MLYAVGFFVPDPFIYLRHGGQTSLVMSDLEIERAPQGAPLPDPFPFAVNPGIAEATS